MRRFGLSSFAVLLMTCPALAQTVSGDELKVLLSLGNRTSSYEEIVAELGRVVRLYDVNGDGVSDEELDVADAQTAARLRAQLAMQFLSADFDNDLRITREEMMALARIGNGDYPGERFEALDQNADGVIDWSEISAFAAASERIVQKERLRRTSLDIDPTPSTPFTLADATALADQLFAAADVNSDRLIDSGERREATEQLRSGVTTLQPGVAPARSCDAPRPQPEDEIMVVGAYEGIAYATSYLGRPDEPTYVVDVRIEPGEEPIYVMATSYHSVIWNFVGAKQRIRHAVLTGRHAQGEIGLPEAIVTFGAAGNCFSADFTMEAKEATASIADFTGRPDFTAAGAYDLYAVSLPSGAVTEPPRQEDRFKPPVTQIAAAAVISDRPAKPYQVLPGRAGLAQLIASGALIEEGGIVFRIVKPIPHFPADLNGAQSVIFLLEDGVPMPAGRPGHSCVRMAKTGKVVTGAIRCS